MGEDSKRQGEPIMTTDKEQAAFEAWYSREFPEPVSVGCRDAEKVMKKWYLKVWKGRSALDMSDELAEALAWVREYISCYVIIHPSRTKDGATPEQKINSVIDSALTKYRSMKGDER